MGLISEWALKWKKYIDVLKDEGVKLKANDEKLTWLENKKIGTITTKLAYDFLGKN